MTTTTRQDPHSVGSIVPANYRHVLTYALARTVDGWPEPSFAVNCMLDRRVTARDPATGALTTVAGQHDQDGRCCVVGLLASGAKMADHGNTGKCTVCGARFNDGEIWMHVPTGEHVHLGHDCAAKYELCASDGRYAAFVSARTAARQGYRAHTAKARAHDAFCAAHPGLAEDLKADHRIIRDIADKLAQYGSLSDAQVALVSKLANEVRNPRAPEQHVAAPEGKVVVRGAVVSTKVVDSQYGSAVKMTVKVETPAGSWLAWSTVPASLLSEKVISPRTGDYESRPLRGLTVEFTATLKRGRDDYFAFASRPTKAKIIE